MPVPLIAEADARAFLRSRVRNGRWSKADRRTHEGRAQLEAIKNGWIEDAGGGGDGYRLTRSGVTVCEHS